MRLSSMGRFAVLCLLLGLTAGRATAATYYLSPTGDDAAAGTAAAPWHTLAKATSSVRAGDTVLLNDGDYVGGADHSRSGTVAAPITYQAINLAKAVIRGDLTTANDDFYVHDCSYVNLIGLDFYKGARAGLYITTTKHVTVQHCIARYGGVQGILTSYSDDLDIEHNTCYGSGQQHGIYVSCSGDRPLIRYNTCYSNPRAGIQVNGGADARRSALGTQGDGIIDGAIIEGNILYNNGLSAAAAINLMSVRDSLIVNNLLYNNKQGGISMFDDQLGTQWGCKNNLVVFNTVYFRPTEGRWCLSFTAGSTGNVVENNILWGGYRGSYMFDNSSSFAADYNLLRERSDVGVATNGQTGAFYHFTLWKSLFSNDVHSTTADPRYVRPSIAPYDFRLVSGSPAIDSGKLDPNVTVDLTGGIRDIGIAPDLGALEGPNAPAVPSGLVVTAGTLSTTLTWKPSSVGSTYTVKRGVMPLGPFLPIAIGVTSTSFKDSGLRSAAAYWYVVSATGGDMQSANSKAVKVTIP